MTPPILVGERGTFYSFDRAEDAENYLEAIDVENEEYRAFDARGQILRLVVEFDAVTIQPTGEYHVDALRELLTKYLEAVHRRFHPYSVAPLPDLTLEQLVTTAHRYARMS